MTKRLHTKFFTNEDGNSLYERFSQALKNATVAIYKNREEISNRIVNYIKYTREYNSVGYCSEDYADWSDIALKFNPNNTEAVALKEFYERQI